MARHNTSRASAGGAERKAAASKARVMAPSTGSTIHRQRARGAQGVGFAFHPLPRLSRKVGFVGERVDNRRVEARGQERQQLGPNAVARNRHILIGLVFHERRGPLGQPGAQLVPPANSTAAGSHSLFADTSPPVRAARRADHPQQHGLGLVVPCVPERHEIGPRLQPRALKERVSPGTSGVFERAPLAARSRRDIFAIDHELQVQRRRQGRDETLIVAGRRPKLVVEVDQADEMQIAGRVEFPQQVGERHRIRSARHGGKHARARTRQIVATDDCRTRSMKTFMLQVAG